VDVSAADIGTAVIVFVATDIDDIVLLAAFFGDATLRPRAIVAGQFIGIAVLSAVSALPAYAALVVPPGWTALLGAIPLGLGLVKLSALWRNRGRGDAAAGSDAAEAEHRIEERLHSQVLAVAALTIANGSDNLSVYIPVFANNVSVVPLYAAIFAFMTALWCALGYVLVKNPAGSAVMQRSGHILLPIVLIAIGLDILSGASVLLR
jgi:cadmium resistance protein CadD (predicted permease)